MLDLPAYLQRTGYAGEMAPTRQALEALHLAHATHIPFENLDVLLGRRIALDLAGIQSKLVDQRRGGYCFEHNLLFAAVLREFGFSLVQLAARVRYRTAALLPRTHMLLLVEADGSRWLADVGFGGEGLLLPVPFDSGAEVRHHAWTWRVIEETESSTWVLQSRRHDAWTDLYAFTLEPQQDVDFEIANHYTSTHPDSRFVQTLTVQLQGPERRMILRNRELIDERGDVTGARTVGDDELAHVLRETFGLDLAPDEVIALQRKA